jgi:hypothetical protein
MTKWRTGRHVGRTVYIQEQSDQAGDNDRLIGVMDTRELAERVVQCVNALEGWDTPLEGVLITPLST